MPTKIDLHFVATLHTLERNCGAGSDAAGRLIVSGVGNARWSAYNEHYCTKAHNDR
jgi:hypothetical protein